MKMYCEICGCEIKSGWEIHTGVACCNKTHCKIKLLEAYSVKIKRKPKDGE